MTLLCGLGLFQSSVMHYMRMKRGLTYILISCHWSVDAMSIKQVRNRWLACRVEDLVPRVSTGEANSITIAKIQDLRSVSL